MLNAPLGNHLAVLGLKNSETRARKQMTNRRMGVMYHIKRAFATPLIKDWQIKIPEKTQGLIRYHRYGSD